MNHNFIILSAILFFANCQNRFSNLDGHRCDKERKEYAQCITLLSLTCREPYSGGCGLYGPALWPILACNGSKEKCEAKKGETSSGSSSSDRGSSSRGSRNE